MNKNERCKFCRHWSNLDGWNGQRRCDNGLVGESPDSDGLWYDSPDKHSAFTGPEFGCVHFEGGE